MELFVSPTRFTLKERIEWIWYFNRVVKIIFWLWRTLTKHALCALFLHCVVSSFYTVACCLYFSKVTIYVSDQKLWTLKRATRHLVGEQLQIPKQFWQYGLSSFQREDTKFHRFFAKNLLSPRKLLNFVKIKSVESSKIGHHFRKYVTCFKNWICQKISTTENVFLKWYCSMWKIDNFRSFLM